MGGGGREERDEKEVMRPREASRGRRAREEMKKQLNLSYFQVCSPSTFYNHPIFNYNYKKA